MNRGKSFEKQFEKDWRESHPDGVLLRLYDPQGGYASVCNPCDYIAYSKGYMYMLECKAHKGNTIPWTVMSQIERMSCYGHTEGLKQAFVIWFEDWDKVVYVPLDTVLQMQADGKKSINVKDIGSYDITVLPSVKARVYMHTDYSSL